MDGHNSDATWGDTTYRGVDYRKRDKRYQARICIARKRVSLGYFNTAEEASEAYNKFKTENVKQIS